MKCPGGRDAWIARIKFGPAAEPASGARSSKSSHGPFGNQSSLELRERREYVKNEFPARRRRIDCAIANGTKTDAASLKIVNQRH